MPRFQKILITIVFLFIVLTHHTTTGFAQKEMPPSPVVISPLKKGTLTPETDFTATVYFHEKSELAAEIAGKVKTENIEEGKRVKKGDVLVEVDSVLLQKTLKAKEAAYNEALAKLDLAKINLQRTAKLLQKDTISEQVYDDKRFSVSTITHEANRLKAEMEAASIEIEKTRILAPFNGVVIAKKTHLGEWLTQGKVVAIIGKDETVEVIAEVPVNVIRAIKNGSSVTIKAENKTIEGTVFSVIPNADVGTRTFPLKIRVKNTYSLMEGMEVQVALPTGSSVDSFIIPRDAVLTVFGNTVVFAVTENKAKMLPVVVTGYEGYNAGITSQAPMQEGMEIAVKGHERLRDGQAVMVVK
ncbi:MAG: efflux RND transporter periplasmic adaptor subunit [Candidatus Magnetoovum sp. WYHC-5]|nr:efflux RND transporter periplasmic adaptor subunit [Candidatus Magnetoovum sp. WYHC-5]